MSKYSLKQRAIYAVLDVLGIQSYRLLANGTIRPGLYYAGWKYRVWAFTHWLNGGRRYFLLRALGVSHTCAVKS
jgi:hypothetical protein